MKLVEAIAIRLTNVIKENGFSFYRIERTGGIDGTTVADIARGEYKSVKINTLYQILSTMGVSLKEFFDDPIFDNISD